MAGQTHSFCLLHPFLSPTSTSINTSRTSSVGPQTLEAIMVPWRTCKNNSNNNTASWPSSGDLDSEGPGNSWESEGFMPQEMGPRPGFEEFHSEKLAAPSAPLAHPRDTLRTCLSRGLSSLEPSHHHHFLEASAAHPPPHPAGQEGPLTIPSP